MEFQSKKVTRTTLQNVVGVVMVLSGGIGMVVSFLYMITQ